MQQVEEEECPLGLPHRGRGTTGDIRCRGEPAAAQIDFYHDTYYCQLTAGDRGAVSGCGVRRGWAAQCLMCGEGRLGAGGWVGRRTRSAQILSQGLRGVTCHVSRVTSHCQAEIS